MNMSSFVFWVSMTVIGFTWMTVSGYFAKDAWEKLHKQSPARSFGDNIDMIQQDDQNGAVGKIDMRDIRSPTQINVGSPGSTQIINDKRMFSREAKVEKGKKGSSFFLRVILTQKAGIWDQGTKLEIQIKTTGPYISAKIVRGLPSALFDVNIGENKEGGEFYFSTTTAPLKDEPVVIEILSGSEINIADLRVTPVNLE